jgi:urea carboxylase
MESPGGYQLVGRTLPIWNTWGRTPPFSPATPWLLRIFDQVRYGLQCV